jgi:hypothetical protein
MSEEKLLVGSLSNDLFRVAALTQRGSILAASRFLTEAQRWSNDLQKLVQVSYVKKIAQDISSRDKLDVGLESAERYLMYGVLLQNYALHSN